MQNPLVPNKNVDCLRDLLTMYQTASLEDVFTAYRHLGLTDDVVFTCVGTSGREPPPPPNAERLRQLYGVSAWPGAAGPAAAADAGSNGSSGGMAGGTDPLAMFAAMIAAAQASNISKAFNMLGSPQQQQQQEGLGQQQQQQLQQDGHQEQQQ
jgi:hypothetical protein